MRRRQESHRAPVPACLWTSLLFLLSFGCAREIVLVRGAESAASLSSMERSRRSALLVMEGLGARKRGRRAIEAWTSTLPYDVYFPDFDTEDGLDGCVRQLRAFVQANQLESYREVYVLAYIMGGWTLNRYLRRYPMKNLRRVVYDRSHIQEQAPRIVMENMPRTARLLYGEVVADLSRTPYQPISPDGLDIGLLIECRAMWYLRWHEDQVLESGPLQWGPETFEQEYDDYMYVDLDHLEMYKNFDLIGDELVHFFENGRFSPHARRKRYLQNPF
jgi:hypothetical protein